MAKYLTTCPACQAQFRITTEQLALKGGKARCGKCSTIFNAKENLTPLTPDTQNVNSPAQDSQPKPSIDKTMEMAVPDDSSLEGLFDDDSLKREEKQKPNMSISEDALIHDDADISEEESDDPFDFGLGDGLSTEFQNTLTNMDTVGEVDFSVKEKNNDNWIEDLLSEEEPEQPKEDEEQEDLIGFLEGIGANTAQFSAVSPTQLGQSVATRKTDQPKVDNQSENQPAMREVRKPQKTGSMIGKTLGIVFWLALSIIALGALATQYVYFNFETLAKDSANTEKLQKVCNIVGCTVPVVNADNIKLLAANTRDNETNKGWTDLTFEIHNQAEVAQIFPYIRVDLIKNNAVVKSNIIPPKKYLLRGYKRLPVSQPIDGKLVLKTSQKSFDSFSLTAMY